MLRTINRLTSRLQRAMRIIRTGEVEAKQFAFLWHNQTAKTGIQWHLTDYETYAMEGYSQNAIANIAIKYKTDSFALVPMRAYSGDVDNPVPLPMDNPLQMLVTRPNPFQSWFQFMQLGDTYYNIDGNCFIYKKPSMNGTAIPEALYTLRPDRVYIKAMDKDGRGDILFLYVPNGRSYPDGIVIESKDIMHIKTPNPLDPLEGMGYGLPGLMPVAQLIDQDNMQTKFLYNIFNHQGIMPGGYIEMPFEMDDEDMLKLRREFEDAHGGYDNWGRPIILDNSAVYKPGSFTLDQLDVSALDTRIVQRVTSVFGVPSVLLGLNDNASTFNNVAEADEAFWKRTMKAELKIFEDEFNFRLRDASKDWFVRWDTSDVPAFQEDLLESSQIYMNLVQHAVPPNIAAQRVNLQIPPIEGGDIPYVLSNLIPLSKAGQTTQTAQTTDRQTDNPDENDMPDDMPDDEDNTVENVPDDETRGNGAIVVAKASSRWDFASKSAIWKSVDDIAADMENDFGQTAVVCFEADKARLADIIADATKAVISWADVRRAMDLYLSTQGALQWRQNFTPVIVELSRRQTDFWSRQAPDVFPPSTYNLRNVTSEAWFNRYTLEFASAVNSTTRDDIHRIIADGLEYGLSNNQLKKNLLALFEQYSYGTTDAETWQFLQERMPDWRRELIARTETHGAMSAGNHALYLQAGVERKEWLATADARTRDDHLVAWNRYSEGGNPGPIAVNQDFIVGGFHMEHPGDRRAPIHQWINCRCTELPFLE